MKASIQNAISAYLKLTIEEREAFLSTIALNSEPADERYLEETKNKNGVICPFCGGYDCVKKNGKLKGRQRYKCNATGKYFTTTTGDVLYHSKKPLQVWKKYMTCFMNKLSLKRCAEECEISVVTAFRWRHKILDALRVMMSEVKLSDVVEADEAFFRISYSGNHKKSRKGFLMPRKAHKRGGEVHKRGLSMEQVCVPCAVDRDNLSVARMGCLGSASNKAISAVLGKHINSGSILCTDKSKAYRTLTEENALTRMKGTSRHRTGGVYSIQHINAYHSTLKNFARGFNGFATKHLNNYLVYHNFLRGVQGSMKDKVKTLLDYTIGVKCHTRCADIANRPELPLAA